MSRGSKHQLPVPQLCEDSTDTSCNGSEKEQDVLLDPVSKKKVKLDDKPLRNNDRKLNKMTDSTTDKRPNFSALNTNIVKIPQVVNLKPGTTKKLVIKNFKSKFFFFLLLTNRTGT